MTRQQDVAEATVGQGEPDTDRSQDYPGSEEKEENKTGTKARTKGPNIPKLTSSVTTGMTARREEDGATPSSSQGAWPKNGTMPNHLPKPAETTRNPRPPDG